MIVLRTKKFVDGNSRFVEPTPFPFPPGSKNLKVIYKCVGENAETGQKPTKFMKERDERIRVCDGPWKTAYKSVMKSIKSGFIYTDRLPEERTHYYPEDSTKDMYYVSKDINPNDRLMYEVYRPKIIKDEDGNDIVSIKVRLVHCSGHTHRDGKKFSKTE